MANYQYDLFVIGAGSGGVRAARMSASYGAKVAIAENRYLGGTCVNVGCVPKKLFVYASHFAEDFKTARSFGWQTQNAQFNWLQLLKNKNTEIERLNGVYQQILDSTGVKTITGRATLMDEHSVSINGEIITAERILVATGGWLQKKRRSTKLPRPWAQTSPCRNDVLSRRPAAMPARRRAALPAACYSLSGVECPACSSGALK